MSSEVDCVEYWYPPGVYSCLNVGNSAWIGIVDDRSVLKFPLSKHDTLTNLELEADIYRHLGPNPYTVQYKGLEPHGILLEWMHKGSLTAYMQVNEIKGMEKTRLCLQIAHALNFFHSKNLICCNLKPDNVLIDDDKNIKFCNFKGSVSDKYGNIIIPAHGIEEAKSRDPHANIGVSNVTTDLFALGTVFYYIVYGHAPFPELDEFDNASEIQARFREQCFPKMSSHYDGRIIRNCWSGKFESAAEVVDALSRWYDYELNRRSKAAMSRAERSRKKAIALARAHALTSHF